MQQEIGTPTETMSHRRNTTLVWAIAAAAVAVVVAALVWMLVADDSDEPTVTFDGESAVYDGPTTFDAGDVTFTFDSSGYEPGVTFVVGEITDPNITFEDLEALAGTIPASSAQPPFIGDVEFVLAVGDQLVVERTIDLEAGRYTVNAHTAPEDTDRVYVATFIEVE